MKVCVIGLGQVGLPTAQYIQHRGLQLIGYDISKDMVQKAANAGIEAVSGWDEIPESEAYVVCVSTSMKANKPDVSAIVDVCSKLVRKLKDETLVSIESTLPLGSSRRVFEAIMRKRGLLIHVPHRYWAGDPTDHGVRQPRVIGAIDDRSMKAGLSFYSGLLDIPLFEVSSIELAEMCKISENAYRFFQIAFAEELRMLSQKLGLDFNQLRQACNTKWNIQIPEAKEGIGGHCLPKDTRYFALLSKKGVMARAAIKADETYKSWLVHTLGKTQ